MTRRSFATRVEATHSLSSSFTNCRGSQCELRQRTGHLIVDTGSDDAVDDSTVRRSPNGPAVTVSTTGLGSSYEAVIGTLDTVRIGHSVFTKVPGVASDVGIVGNGIWSRFVCIFDYAHKRLFVEPK